MEPLNQNAARLRDAAIRADALARLTQRIANEVFRQFLKCDGNASPDQAIEAARQAPERRRKLGATTSSTSHNSGLAQHQLPHRLRIQGGADTREQIGGIARSSVSQPRSTGSLEEMYESARQNIDNRASRNRHTGSK